MGMGHGEKMPKAVQEEAVKMSMAEALEALQYLTVRNKLCTQCGYKLAEVENAMHSLCNDCSKTRETMVFNPIPQSRKATDFEVLLSRNLGRWVQDYLAANPV
jgi:hypothetical protein